MIGPLTWDDLEEDLLALLENCLNFQPFLGLLCEVGALSAISLMLRSIASKTNIKQRTIIAMNSSGAAAMQKVRITAFETRGSAFGFGVFSVVHIAT